MTTSKINSSAALGNALVSAIDDFLHNFTKYATDVVVGIQPQTFDIILDSPNKIPADYRQHSIADFILTNDRGMYEPDEKTAFMVAEHYF